MGNNQRVCVTGASGRIGRHLVARLVADGYAVRAITSQPVTGQRDADGVEWMQHDFRRSLDFSAAVADCAAVLHLAAEIWRISEMERVNVEATTALARDAAAAGVRYFGFTSSVAVYGSARQASVTENTPVLTADRDIASEYRGTPSVRAYGRSKVRCEQALASELGGIECTIMRPTVVVDLNDIRAMLGRSAFERIVLARRHEHMIYLLDVVNALVWFMRRALERPSPETGVSVFNLSDDESAIGTSAAFFARAAQISGKGIGADRFHAPYFVYDFLDLAKNRTISNRKALGGMFYSSEALRATGYRHLYGMEKALDIALSADVAAKTS